MVSDRDASTHVSRQQLSEPTPNVTSQYSVTHPALESLQSTAVTTVSTANTPPELGDLKTRYFTSQSQVLLPITLHLTLHHYSNSIFSRQLQLLKQNKCMMLRSCEANNA